MLSVLSWNVGLEWYYGHPVKFLHPKFWKERKKFHSELTHNRLQDENIPLVQRVLAEQAKDFQFLHEVDNIVQAHRIHDNTKGYDLILPPSNPKASRKKTIGFLKQGTYDKAHVQYMRSSKEESPFVFVERGELLVVSGKLPSTSPRKKQAEIKDLVGKIESQYAGWRVLLVGDLNVRQRPNGTFLGVPFSKGDEQAYTMLTSRMHDLGRGPKGEGEATMTKGGLRLDYAFTRGIDSGVGRYHVLRPSLEGTRMDHLPIKIELRT